MKELFRNVKDANKQNEIKLSVSDTRLILFVFTRTVNKQKQMATIAVMIITLHFNLFRVFHTFSQCSVSSF